MVTFEQALVDISSFAGNRFDLVQAGGGNSSVKLDDTRMLIKASGISLSEVTLDEGYVAVDFTKIRQFLSSDQFSQLDKKQREALANQLMADSKLSTTGKPSIETFLHALLGPYTLHTHPISVNVLTAKENWRSELLGIWPDAVCVPYHTPGIDLALAMAAEVQHYEQENNRQPEVIFLQNHGLIVSSSEQDQVAALTDAVCIAIEKSLAMDLSRYRQVSQIQKIMTQLQHQNVSILCNDDAIIQSALSHEDHTIHVWPFCPDTLIYCGVKPAFMSSITNVDAIIEYQAQFQEYPKVIVINNTVYFCANSLKKAKEAQDLFKFHLIVRQHSDPDIQRITMDEVAYLSNWDAEKYRQGV